MVILCTFASSLTFVLSRLSCVVVKLDTLTMTYVEPYVARELADVHNVKSTTKFFEMSAVKVTS